MKLSLVALVACACAVGATPAALAQTETAEINTASASPALESGIEPISNVQAEYPFRERRARAEGECTVLFDVAATGAVENVRTRECTTRDFEREARRVAEDLRYPADAVPAEGLRDQSFKIRWEGEGA